MANLQHSNGQTVQTDNIDEILDFLNRGFTAQPGTYLPPTLTGYSNYLSSMQGGGTPQPSAYPTTVQAQPGIMSGIDNLQTGQGTIIANQGVLQNDVQGVGNQVSGVQNTLGSPTSTGQTVFGDLGNLRTGQEGIMGSVSGVTDALGDFRNQFTNYSSQATTQRDMMQRQGLNQRDQIIRDLQDMQPIMRPQQGQSPVAQSAASATYNSPGVMAPSIQTTTQGMTAVANNQNTPIGPLGPMAVDPRDYV